MKQGAVVVWWGGKNTSSVGLASSVALSTATGVSSLFEAKRSGVRQQELIGATTRTTITFVTREGNISQLFALLPSSGKSLSPLLSDVP